MGRGATRHNLRDGARGHVGELPHALERLGHSTKSDRERRKAGDQAWREGAIRCRWRFTSSESENPRGMFPDEGSEGDSESSFRQETGSHSESSHEDDISDPTGDLAEQWQQPQNFGKSADKERVRPRMEEEMKEKRKASRSFRVSWTRHEMLSR